MERSARTTTGDARGWEGRLARGFRLARVALDVLASDRRLVVLPMASALCALLAVLAIAALAGNLRGEPELLRVVAPVWAAAYAISFVTIFFNVALVHVVARRWRGEPVRLLDGIGAAGVRVVAIAGWAVLTTTVGLLVQLLERATFGLARALLGPAWTVTSFFVVPVLVVERGGPLAALRRSGRIVRERWAEGIGGGTPIALATLMVVLPLAGLIFIGLVLFATGLTGLGLLAMTGGAVAIVAVLVVGGAVSQIFTLAVYQHATGGPYDDGFPVADLERPRDARASDGKPRKRLRVR